MEGTALRMRESLTPEEKVERRKKILRRFRVIVRLVMAHRYWLGEVEDTQMSDNVRKNIRLLLKKKKILSSLTIKEKSILSKPKEDRTEEEKAHLSKVIGGMKCFRRYPPETKSQLAGCTYFVYFPPQRDIVKQDQPAQAMYFILSGECKVSVSHFDKYLQEYLVEQTGTLGPGATFGEISLIHGENRLATITTITDCEMFMIKKEDFNSIIRETVLKTWNEIQSVLGGFTYFKNWDDVTKRETAILTKIRHFAPDDTILGDNAGLHDFVYFITKGTCCIIENLIVTVFCIKGIETYTLNPLAEDDVMSVALTNIFKKYKRYLVGSADTISVSTTRSRRDSKASQYSSVSSKSTYSKRKQIKCKYDEGGEYCPNLPQNKTASISFGTSSIFSSLESKHPPAYGRPYFREEVHFIKVCELYAGGCFNIGEKLNRRRIIALTPVSCCLIPRYWVMRNNKGNIWNMVQQYLNHNIPSTEEIFKKFVEKKKFQKYSKSLIKDILTLHNVHTGNSIHNIPYSIRLRDGVDTDFLN